MKSSREIVELLALYRAQVIDKLGLKPNAVSSAYSFIIIDAGDMHIKFEISATSAKLYELYPVSDQMKTKIESISWPGLDSVSQQQFPDHITKHLTTADSIASLALNCTAGDDYRPGNFSKVTYANTYIELQQVNYLNAKSLDHKNDYSLRSLVFRIPLSENSKMITEFTDRSSENNRHCGDRIQAALDWHPG